jgi:hypothetical protein
VWFGCKDVCVVELKDVCVFGLEEFLCFWAVRVFVSCGYKGLSVFGLQEFVSFGCESLCAARYFVL